MTAIPEDIDFDAGFSFYSFDSLLFWIVTYLFLRHCTRDTDDEPAGPEPRQNTSA